MKKRKQKSIPNNLRKYRRAKGLTQKEVAFVLGLKGITLLSRWESGVRVPGLLDIFKLALLYRTMVDALFMDLRRSLKDEISKQETRLLQARQRRQNTGHR